MSGPDLHSGENLLADYTYLARKRRQLLDLKLRLYFFENGPNPPDVWLLGSLSRLFLAVLDSHLFPKLIHNNHRLYEMIDKSLICFAYPKLFVGKIVRRMPIAHEFFPKVLKRSVGSIGCVSVATRFPLQAMVRCSSFGHECRLRLG